MRPTILVTGAAGYIGRALSWHLRGAQSRPVILTDVVPKSAAPDDDHYHECDLTDVKAVRALFREFNPITVVHLAGQTTVGAQSDSNVVMVNNIIVAALERNPCSHIMAAGSAAEYGSLGPEDRPFTERSPLNPLDPYAESKVECARALELCSRSQPTTVMRLANVYGPHQRNRVIPFMIDAVSNGSPIKLNGQGRAIRQFVYVEDVCRAVTSVIRGCAYGVLNIGGTQELSMKSLADMVTVAVHDHALKRGRTPKPVAYHLSDSNPGAMRVAVDYTYAQTRLGWRPMINLYDGLKATVLTQLGD